MMQSILQKRKECYITHSTVGLHKHHIFGGANRNISEKNGFWVWLRYDLHNLSNDGVHNDYQFNLQLKQKCQKEFEKTRSRQEFMKLIGRNYLDW
ncbi:MAG: hypothetical protein J6J24_00435 [Clostridia bacterium]|nr:hypothetical protein [Clostridia bacterium]